VITAVTSGPRSRAKDQRTERRSAPHQGTPSEQFLRANDSDRNHIGCPLIVDVTPIPGCYAANRDRGHGAPFRRRPRRGRRRERRWRLLLVEPVDAVELAQ